MDCHKTLLFHEQLFEVTYYTGAWSNFDGFSSILSHEVFLIIKVFLFFQSEVQITQVASPRSYCGEGPHWDVATQSLYYIDIDGPNETILRYDYYENKTYGAKVDGVPLMTFVLPVEETVDEFLVGTKRCGQIIRWDGKSPKGKFVRTVFEVETDIQKNRFNDAKADPAGRFVGGTQSTPECGSDPPNASLYSYDQTNGVKRLLKDISISNGLTWVKKAHLEYTFYYIDSCTRSLLAFDYDIESGSLGELCRQT